MVIHIVTSEMKLEVLSLAFVLSVTTLVGFGFSLLYNYAGDDPLLTGKDKYTVFLRKNWLWVIPLVSFGIGLIGALIIIGSVQNT